MNVTVTSLPPANTQPVTCADCERTVGPGQAVEQPEGSGRWVCILTTDCARHASVYSNNVAVLERIAANTSDLPRVVTRNAAGALSLFQEIARDDRRVIAWAESRLNGVGYTTWMQVCEALPQADPFEIALVMDQRVKWWGSMQANEIARWVRATLAGEPTDEDCDLYREHDWAIGRAAATGSGLSLETYE